MAQPKPILSIENDPINSSKVDESQPGNPPAESNDKRNKSTNLLLPTSSTRDTSTNHQVVRGPPSPIPVRLTPSLPNSPMKSAPQSPSIKVRDSSPSRLLNSKPMSKSTSSNLGVSGTARVNSGSATGLTIELGTHLDLTSFVAGVNNQGNPRNKCALQPGHSLMDWIRLGNSGKDLTGVGGRMRPVSPKELSCHNTQRDAWIAIRGRVYNVTHYLPFHPGGPDELMRGAGIDATQLFDKIHPWVNYDSILSKCLIGPLREERPDAEEVFGFNTPKPSDRLQPSKAQELVRKSMENLANCITPVKKRISSKSSPTSSEPNRPLTSKIVQSLVHSSELPVSIGRAIVTEQEVKEPVQIQDAPPPLRFDWIQTSSRLTLSVYTRALSNPGARVKLSEDTLFVEVLTDDWIRDLTLKPERQLKSPVRIRIFAESGKIEISAQKIETGLWSGVGASETGVARRRSGSGGEVRTTCKVRARRPVTHDTSLLLLAPPAGVVFALPVGHHLRLHCTSNGTECVRSYTPIGDGWCEGLEDSTSLTLCVKRYERGALTPLLATLPEDCALTVSGPYGSFDLHNLRNVSRALLVAAGTGVTPMMKLILFMLARSNPRSQLVHLMFFNKKEEDIMFRDKFEQISLSDERFKVSHVLSEPSDSWSGQSGRVRSDLLTTCFGVDSLKCSEDCVHYACVCGPSEFTHLTVGLLRDLGVKESCVHAFLG